MPKTLLLIKSIRQLFNSMAWLRVLIMKKKKKSNYPVRKKFKDGSKNMYAKGKGKFGMR